MEILFVMLKYSIVKQFKENFFYLISLAILIFIVYANSLGNSFVSDDNTTIAYLLKNGIVNSVITRPLAASQFILLFIAYKIAGLNPVIYRLINIFFHIGSTWLIFLFFSFLTNSNLAFLGAAIFSVHPILVESVAWISGGPYIRYSFFILLSLITYRKKKYILSIIFFILCLLSSEKGIIFPLILVLYEICFGNLKKNWKWTIPYFSIAVALVLLYLPSINIRVAEVSIHKQNHLILLNPLLQIPIALTYYLQLIFWPDKLTLYHSELFFSFSNYLVRLFITLGILSAMVVLLKKNKLLFFWLAFFFISLLPTLTPLRISWIVAERYVYLGLIGIIFVFCYFLDKLITNKKTKIIGYFLFLIIILSLMIRTIIRNIDWKNEDNLWLATGKTSPSDPVTHINLGDYYGRHKDFQKSIAEFKLAIKLNPNYADAYHDLGNTYLQVNMIDEALASYEKAFQFNPSLWQSPMMIASIYFNEKKYAVAVDYMYKAIKANPQNSILYSNLGIIYLKLGDKKQAERAFLMALRFDPYNKQARVGLTAL